MTSLCQIVWTMTVSDQYYITYLSLWSFCMVLCVEERTNRVIKAIKCIYIYTMATDYSVRSRHDTVCMFIMMLDTRYCTGIHGENWNMHVSYISYIFLWCPIFFWPVSYMNLRVGWLRIVIALGFATIGASSVAALSYFDLSWARSHKVGWSREICALEITVNVLLQFAAQGTLVN